MGRLGSGPLVLAQLLSTPTSYLLLLSTLATMIAKAPVIAHLHGIGFWPARWVAACATDIAFFLGLGALLALGQHVRRRMLFATLPIALLATTVAIINGCYLLISGEHLTCPVVMLGLQRFGDVTGIVGATAFIQLGTTLLILFGAIAVPAAALYILSRRQHPFGIAVNGLGRDRALGACATSEDS